MTDIEVKKQEIIDKKNTDKYTLKLQHEKMGQISIKWHKRKLQLTNVTDEGSID